MPNAMIRFRRRGSRRTLLLSSLLVLLLTIVSCGPSRIIYEVPAPRSVSTVASDDLSAPGLKFLVFGDQGSGNKLQSEVASGMAAMRMNYGAEFVLGTGDNFYPRGVKNIRDSKWRTRFEEIYNATALPIPFYMTLGNHDYEGSPEAQVRYTRINARWHMPKRYYAFSKSLPSANRPETADFFAVDTPRLIGRGGDKTQLQWLEEALRKSHARWKFVFGHHPPHTNGHHRNEAYQHRLTPLVALLEKYRVNVLFSGHEHDLQVLRPIQGVSYMISGAAGKHRNVRWSDNTCFAWTNGGFLWCSLTSDRLLLVVCDKDGNPLWMKSIPHTGAGPAGDKPRF